MEEEQQWNIPRINNRPVSIYSMLVENNGLLLGCGAWNRKLQEHSMAVKNATAGMILRVDWQGRVVAESVPLGNIVYPMIRLSGGECFIGCRTGAAYFMDERLKVNNLGNFGGGVYGAAFSVSLNRLILGGRDGTLFSLRPDGSIVGGWATPANRLWNLCPDRFDDRYIWASSYNGILYKLDSLTGEIKLSFDFGPGAVTLVSWLSNGMLAAGSFKKKVFLFDSGGQLVKAQPVRGGVCFLSDLPELNAFYATDYDGRVWISDYEGRVLDQFDADVSGNNPIWIAQQLDSNRIILAWANGIVRVLKY